MGRAAISMAANSSVTLVAPSRGRGGPRPHAELVGGKAGGIIATVIAGPLSHASVRADISGFRLAHIALGLNRAWRAVRGP